MKPFKCFLTFVCLVSVAAFAADPPTGIKVVPMKDTSPASGRDMFKEYCAVCHGADAKGHGPAASALKVVPPDLTLLSQNNHGKFPDRRVYAAIRGDVNYAAHGSNDMPIWGAVFRDMNHGIDSAQPAERMSNLCRYIASLQRK
jgi:mono/diheme cytochrome c family protein